MLPEPLARTPADEDVARVAADRACDMRRCHDAIAKRRACAVIPPRRTATPRKTETVGAGARNEPLRAAKHLEHVL